jgi:hypothetical protein
VDPAREKVQPGTLLQTGHAVPHFSLTLLDGTRFAYADIWQQKNLLLVLLADDQPSEDYAGRLRARMSDITACETACVTSRDEVAGVLRPGVVIADKWGEVHVAAGADAATGLPTPDDLIEWLRYVQMQCPECQGETR